MGPVLAQIDRTDLADVSGVEESSAKISDCAEVASFSWLNRKESTILVPGWLSDTSHRWTPKAFFFLANTFNPIQESLPHGRHYRIPPS